MDEITVEFADLGIEASLLERLNSEVFNHDEAVDAVHGRKLPQDLGVPTVRYCVIRGLRHHLDFAVVNASTFEKGPAMFKKAVNARLIMSNKIPDMDGPEDRPYCIWHPDLPSETALQKLVERYPDMVYQVGRVCAFAGYNDLYKTLDILPEVAIAEEAQDRGNKAIFDLIMEKPVRWKVFYDYNVCMLDPKPANLNHDTVLYRSLAF
ncbi:hypothetical protein VHEMI03948 [[Torrubiella] hemipterigena]|uniref:Uncharacterized protein n=1 Tax=[Torrubiella] hemipterigena TaxID=1531966 RepID=A0A0A1TCD5_9HYPO|nr:hypothetical protein VHEMI03948 [[Torrubiella] hemipterigena]